MECNKDDAMKAKQIAESKLRNGDFVGAQKFARKAQQLYPELDNVSQILTVCDVHCSAQNRILGSEKDWYGILQIERSADEASIKKQYRKLALLLHPDKNKFAGAEAAFKLIGEAHRVLLDETGRSVYDLKCRAAVRTSAQSQPQSAKWKSSVKKQTGTGSNFPNGGPHPFENAEKTTFWTSCSNCGMRYQYYRTFVNKIMRCQSCQQSFTAFDLGTQSGPQGFPWHQFHNQSGVSNPGMQNGFLNPGSSREASKGSGSCRNFSAKFTRFDPVSNAGNASQASRCSKTQEKVDGRPGLNEYVRMPKPNLANGKASGRISKSNVGKPSVLETSRNSTKRKWKSTGSADEHHRELKQKARYVEESMPDNKSNSREYKAEWMEADFSDFDDENILHPDVIEYPDPDFSDFDKDRAENCFSVNQFWAVYDTCDGMPRFYVWIKKVLTPGFKLLITWLEPNPDDESEKAWCDVELPIACGKFIIGRSEETEDRLMFSHQISWMNGAGRRSFLVYPKVGETWAIFKDWDINWISDPEKHKPPYQYEFVEVLRDFDETVGIGVAFLDKVNGFVSLFQQTARCGVLSFSIAPAHLYRFSHRVPSFRMTGKEREGVPVGSFEFDPASLPENLSELDDPDDVKIEREKLVTKSNGSSPKSAEGKENLMSRRSASGSNGEMLSNNQVDASQCINERGGRIVNERIKTPKKHTVCAVDALKLRRSPRDLGKKNDQLNASQHEVQEEVNKHSDAKKVKKQSSILQFMGSVSSSQSIDKMHLHAREGSSTGVMESFNAPSFPSSDHKITEDVCHDFKAERSEDKFESNQIWALYSDADGMPKNYAQVKIIDFTPDFRLHVVPLEACSASNASNQPVCCGTFQVKNVKTKVFPLTAFSHRPRAEAIGGNRFEICPRKGDIWAVYKKGNSELSVSDRQKGECDFMEIMDDHEQNIKVVVLSRVNGSNSLYRVPSSQSSRTGLMEIPRTDLTRFSHQIPAFRLTGEKNIWNLDPSAIPGATPGTTIID